jgi:hypothetical protein
MAGDALPHVPTVTQQHGLLPADGVTSPSHVLAVVSRLMQSQSRSRGTAVGSLWTIHRPATGPITLAQRNLLRTTRI